MDICIIGGGLTGLSAALSLSKAHEVTIFEKRPILGGCLASYDKEKYQIEEYYHHCFSGDQRLFALLSELNLKDKLEWLKGSTGYCIDGTIHPLTSPLDILRYPHLTIPEKARLAILTLRAKNFDLGSLDDIPAKEFILDKLGDGIYTSFFEPLLKSKFGNRRDEVSAAWLLSRIAIRSDRGVEGERLGYLSGGWHELVDAMALRAEKQGCQIKMNNPVTSITRSGEKWKVNGELFDIVLATTPPQEVGRLIGTDDFTAIPYQGAACLTIGLDRDISKGIYWINMKDQAPYGAVVSHTNFAPRERYGEEIVYLASYFAEQPAPNLKETMLNDFCSRFSVPKTSIHWAELAVERLAGPVYTTGFRHLIPDYEKNGIYLSGMFSPPNYPERSMEGSITAGQEVAAHILGAQHD